MKRFLLLLAASTLVLVPAAHAAKAKKTPANAEANAALLKKYDANANGKIDGDEVAAIRKDFATTTDEDLKALDTDHDGKLSDSEIAALSSAKKPKKKKA